MIPQIFIMCGLGDILITGIVRWHRGWHHSRTIVDKIAIFCFWIPVYCSSNITSYTSWWFCILTSFFEQHCFLFLDFWQAKCAYAFSISILPLPFLIVYTYDTCISFFIFWKKRRLEMKNSTLIPKLFFWSRKSSNFFETTRSIINIFEQWKVILFFIFVTEYIF